jgi:hypothetical protein
MAINKQGGAYLPDFYSGNAQQPWVNFDEDPQVNLGPAVSAFKQRFMQGAPSVQTDAPHLPDMPVMAPHEDLGGGQLLHGADALSTPVKKGMGGSL